MDEKKEVDGQQKVLVDLEGKQAEPISRVLTGEGEKRGVFVAFELVEVPKFGSKTGERENKVIAQIQFEGVEGFVPAFFTPTVTKSSNPKYSNSRLFDLLEKAKLTADFGNENLKEGGMSQDQLTGYLENRLQGAGVRCLVENTKGEKPYSVVKKVYEVFVNE